MLYKTHKKFGYAFGLFALMLPFLSVSIHTSVGKVTALYIAVYSDSTNVSNCFYTIKTSK